MFRRLLDRAAPARPVAPDSPRSNPDAGYDAVPRFDRLARALAAAVRTPPAPPRWREGKLFFFDRRRQAELEAARPAHVAAEPFPELAALVTAELPALFASSELRHVARAVPGLRSAAAALAPRCAAARDLAELLAVPDDEAFVVLHPGRRVGCRVAVRGVADVGRFHVLLAAAAPELAAAGAGF